MLIVSGTGSLQMVSLRNLETIAQAPFAEELPLSCAFSSDGKQLLTTGHRGSMKLWDGHTLKLLAAQRRRRDPMQAGEFSRDRQLLVVAYRDRSIELCDAQTLGLVCSGLRGFEALKAIFFSHGDTRIGLIERAIDPAVRYLSVPSLTPLGEPILLGQTVSLCRRSPDRSEWAMADDNGEIWIRRDRTFEIVAKLGDGESLTSMDYSADGSELVCVTRSRRCWRWNIARGTGVVLPQQPSPRFSAYAWNEKYFAGPDGAGRCTLEDRFSDVVLRVRDERMAAATTVCRFGASDAYFVCGLESGDVVVWHRQDLKPVHVLRPHRTAVVACAVSIHGDFVFSADQDGRIVFGRSDPLSPPLWSKRVDDVPVAMTISPRSPRALSVGASGAVTLWNLDSGESMASFRPAHGVIEDGAFSFDDRIVLLGSRDGPLLWDERTGHLTHAATRNRRSVLCRFVGDQLDESRIYSRQSVLSDLSRKKPWPDRASDATPALLKVGDRVYSRKSAPPHAVSADGGFLLSGHDDGMLRLWDLATTTCIAEMRCTNTAVASWSLAENRLICAYGDAWRKLGWLARDANGVMRRWPLEIFGHECEPIPPHLQLS